MADWRKLHEAIEQLRKDVSAVSDEELATMAPAAQRLVRSTRSALATYFEAKATDAEASRR